MPVPPVEGGLAFLYPGRGTPAAAWAWLRRERAATAVLALVSESAGWDVAPAARDRRARTPVTGTRAEVTAFALGVAAHRVLAERGVRPAAVAGLSGAEVCALWASGVVDLEDAARLAVARARLVAERGSPGAMAEVEGLAPATVDQLCSACGGGDVLVVAVETGPRHAVVSGTSPAVERLVTAARRAGARRAARLVGPPPLHSPRLRPAHKAWLDMVASVRLRSPVVPLALGATGEVAVADSAPGPVRAALGSHLVAPVRWRRCVERLVSLGVGGLVECGPGRTLEDVHRSVAPDVPAVSACDLASVVALEARSRRG